MKEVIQIEITKSEWKPNAFCMRIGDVKGSTEISNVSKEDLMGEISDEINNLITQKGLREVINELDDSQHKYASKNLGAMRETKCSRSEESKNLDESVNVSEKQNADTSSTNYGIEEVKKHIKFVIKDFEIRDEFQRGYLAGFCDLLKVIEENVSQSKDKTEYAPEGLAGAIPDEALIGTRFENQKHKENISNNSAPTCKTCGYKYIPKIDFGGCCSYDCQKKLIENASQIILTKSNEDVNKGNNTYENVNKGCGKYETRGAYTFTCGSSTREGKIQYCKECKKHSKGVINSQEVRRNAHIVPPDTSNLIKKELGKDYE